VVCGLESRSFADWRLHRNLSAAAGFQPSVVVCGLESRSFADGRLQRNGACRGKRERLNADYLRT
jgi:hypothetical protein